MSIVTCTYYLLGSPGGTPSHMKPSGTLVVSSRGIKNVNLIYSGHALSSTSTKLR